MDEIQTFLREDLDFIGGHPLAGKECSGFAHASSDIFGRANYIITPVPNNRKESLDLVEKMVLGIGCREPIYMSPGRHDEIIALTSQLPHIIAAALINSSEYENTGSLVGGSFKDATRVARMNVPLWSELFLENRENVLNQIDRFLDHMTSLKMSILQQDQDALNKLLNRANSARIKF
jgi:prephenate dehydrogenase